MSTTRLFRISNFTVSPLASHRVRLERDLQVLIERNLSSLLGVSFLSSEYTTGSKHRGRIDTLGIDENGCPVIIEYKRSTNGNLLTQGLFYLDWLMDHKAQFENLYTDSEHYSEEVDVDWSNPRLICVAESFNRYDIHAVEQINRNIDLVKYSLFADDLLMLTLINRHESAGTQLRPSRKLLLSANGDEACASRDNTNGSVWDDKPEEMRALWDKISEYVFDLGDGDEVILKERKYYIAFQRIRNFLWAYPSKKHINLWLKIDPASVDLEEGFSRDVSAIRHRGCGDLELRIHDEQTLEAAKPFLAAAFAGNGEYVAFAS